MALNIPMPDSPGDSLIKGLDAGSTLMSRMMQPILERERIKQQQVLQSERLKQQQAQFVQHYALQKQAQDKANALLPYMIQEYQDKHRTQASEADIKDMHRSLIHDALSNPASGAIQGNLSVSTGIPPQVIGGQPNTTQGEMLTKMGIDSNPPASLPGTEQSQATPQIGGVKQPMGGQEHELRSGNPRLSRLDAVAGLMPGIPKPATHFSNGMLFTTYPSGRMTVQQVQGSKTPGEKNVSAKEASKIRDQATALVNSANLVQQGYGLLDANPDLTGPGNITSAIPIPFSGGSKINLSNNPELGKFTTVTGKLQAELGKYAASRGGIQAVKWAGSVKPNAFNPEGYNYGMFEGIQQNLQDDYKALNDQYKAVTGENLPISLPKMESARGKKSSETSGSSESGKGKVTKWKMKGGQLVKE